MNKKEYDDFVQVGSVVQIGEGYPNKGFQFTMGIVSRTFEEIAKVVVAVPSSLHDKWQAAELTVKIKDFEYIGEAVYVPEHLKRVVEEIRTQNDQDNEQGK